MGRLRLLFVLALALGCSPEIGDECAISTDCSQSGDRLCDITQPGGYCTMFNCEPGDCPDEASCVLFGVAPSTLEGCEDPFGVTPYQRSFCLKTCESDDDCRSGYECANFADPDNPWGAVVADGGGRVCAVPYSGVPVTDEPPSTDICSADSPSSPPDSGVSGAGGASGGGASAGGASGMSGAEGGASGAVSEGGSAGQSGAGGQGGG